MTKSNGQPALNPFASIRSIRDGMLDALSKTAIDAVNTDSFAQWLGAYQRAMLTMSEPAQRALDQTMQVMLPRLNLPSRDELAAVARRMTNIEMRLDDLDQRLDQLMPAPAAAPSVDARLAAIEARLDTLLAALQAQQPAAPPAAPPARRAARSRKAPKAES